MGEYGSLGRGMNVLFCMRWKVIVGIFGVIWVVGVLLKVGILF